MKQLFILAVAMIIGTAVQAQEVSKEQRARIKAKELALELNLSEKQTAQVTQLVLKNQALMQDNKLTAEQRAALTPQQKADRKEARLDAQIARSNEMKEILTPAQFGEWKNKMDRMRKNQNKQHAQNRPERRKK